MRQINNNIFLNNRKTILLSGLFLVILFFTFTILPLGKMALSAEDNNNEEVDVEENNKKIEQLKEEIRQVQSEVDKQVLEIKAKQKETRTLKSEVSIYENKIYKNELEVKETKLITEETELEIEKTEDKIEESKIKIEKDRIILKDFVQLLYSYEQDSLLEVLITKESFSDFFNEVDAVESVKDEIFETIVNLKDENEKAELQKEEFEEQNKERHQLVQMRIEQSNSLDDLKEQRSELLKITKGEEMKFQQIMEENKNILPSLRAQLYDLQSLGQKIEVDDAFSSAKLIGSRIGVRPAFLLGILKVESDLGKNTGSGNWENDMYGCYLRLSEIYSSRRAHYVKRANTEKDAFFSIVNRLNLDPMSVKVSREPTYGCGGAMGPAQFIPSTWLAYENRVGDVLGHHPPNPWNLTDAMTAMAVKVSDIPGVVGGNRDSEYEAAGRYLGGVNWKAKGLSFYPQKVMLYAELYAEELK